MHDQLVAVTHRQLDKSLLVDNVRQSDLKSTVISPDLTRVMRVRRRKSGFFMRKSFVEVDGIAGPEYETIRFPTFSPNSKRFVYVARAGNRDLLILDGQEIYACKRLGTSILQPGFDAPGMVLQGSRGVVPCERRDVWSKISLG